MASVAGSRRTSPRGRHFRRMIVARGVELVDTAVWHITRLAVSAYHRRALGTERRILLSEWPKGWFQEKGRDDEAISDTYIIWLSAARICSSFSYHWPFVDWQYKIRGVHCIDRSWACHLDHCGNHRNRVVDRGQHLRLQAVTGENGAIVGKDGGLGVGDCAERRECAMVTPHPGVADRFHASKRAVTRRADRTLHAGAVGRGSPPSSDGLCPCCSRAHPRVRTSRFGRLSSRASKGGRSNFAASKRMGRTSDVGRRFGGFAGYIRSNAVAAGAEDRNQDSRQ